MRWSFTWGIVAPVIWSSPQDPSIAPCVNVALRGASKIFLRSDFLMEMLSWVMKDLCFTTVWGVKMELSRGKWKNANYPEWSVVISTCGYRNLKTLYILVGTLEWVAVESNLPFVFKPSKKVGVVGWLEMAHMVSWSRDRFDHHCIWTLGQDATLTGSHHPRV